MVNAMKKIAILFILGFTIIFGNSNFSQADYPDFKFEAGLLDSTYLPYEPITLDLMVTSTSKDTIRVKTLSVYSENVWIVLINNNGDTLKPTESREVIPGPGVLLKPKETYYTNVNLGDLYGRGLLHKRLLIGSYQIQVRYSQRSSPILSFEVKEPKGIEKKAYELLTKGYTHQLAKEPDQAIKSFHDIIAQFTKSEYVELAYFYLAQSYRFYKGDTKKSDSLQAVLIRKFPNSYFVRGAIDELIKDKTTDEQKKFLTNLIKDYPNTRCAKFAQRKLRGW